MSKTVFLYSKNSSVVGDLESVKCFKPPVASAAVCSEAVVLLWLINCLLLLKLYVGV